MPVVPMPSRQPSAKPAVPVQPMPPEPFQLMAAAQMHLEGRLVEGNPSIEDRRNQTSKEVDRNMVEDQQLPPIEPPNLDKNYSMARGMGAKDLDEAAINAIITRGLAAHGK